MIRSLVGIALVAWLAFASTAQETPKGAAVTKEENLAYPTFEPFTSSRMFKVIAPDLEKVNLADLAKELGTVSEIGEESKRVAERATGTEKPKGPSAALLPELPKDARSLYSILPIVMMKLAPLWDTQSWSAEQVKLAQDAAKILTHFKGAPAFTCAEGKQTENRAALEALVRWFHATAARPECFAAMIFTMDDGPFAGLPYETTEVIATTSVQKLDEITELRLAKAARPKEPWILQCVRDGKLLWSRVVSAAPDESVAEVSFASTPPLKIGAYGWKVYMRVKWSYGPEQAHLYVDAKANPPFYFLSW